jgi:large subunit ribosomal protein L21
MFAVIKTGGKQYKVAADDKITVMLLQGDAGAEITFSEVLALYDGEINHIGAPLVAGASVTAEIVEQARGPKVYAFKKRRRKNSKRKRGHKQDLTIVRIVDIVGVDGKRLAKHEGKSEAKVKSEAPVSEPAAAEAPAA